MFKLFKINIFKSVYYSLKFRAKILVGRGTRLYLANGAKINGFGVIQIGVDYFGPVQETILEMSQNSSLIFAGNVNIKKGSNFFLGRGAKLEIGANTYFNQNTIVRVSSELKIGSSCAISWGVNIIDSDEHRIFINGQENEMVKKITISDNVWVGCNVIILKGVFLDTGVIVAAGSVVTSSFDSRQLVAGIPAKVIYKNVAWLD
ncbi:acyltransferase [Shewanella insulae]|uniref:acyltransferase n=1 Tax=Shewanella insulae TaxID=2681496 RepID=UPI0024805CC8|nr:acyltransferase [Shewanella insulae]